MKKIKVKVLPYFGPRKSERTFPPVFGSVGNLGRKKVTLHQFGLNRKG